MICGKLTESIFERSVKRVIQMNVGGAGLEADCATLTSDLEDKGSNVNIISGQAIANGMDNKVAVRAYIAAINQMIVYCANLSVLEIPHAYVNMTLLIPETLREIKVRSMIENVSLQAKESNIPILNCNAQVLPTLTEVVAVCVANADASSEMGIEKIKPAATDEDIVMTKWIALEGSALIGNDSFNMLCKRYPRDLVEEAAGFYKYLSIMPEVACAMKSSASSMLMPREGGIFGGLWQLAKRKGVGLVVDLKCIPIRQETVEICEYFDINPYELLAGGCLLATTQDGNKLVHMFENIGVFATVIGHTIKGNERIICRDGETRYLEPARGDEIFRYYRKQKAASANR